MFFSRKPASSLILIIDVQSALVRGTLVNIRSRRHPEIVLTSSVVIPYRPSGGSAFLMTRAIEAISMISTEALRYISERASDPERASEALPRSIDAVHFVLSSPWIMSQAKTLSLSFQSETDIDAERILGLMADERAKLLSRSTEPLIPVEEKIFDVKLNGYTVTDWEGVKAKDVSVSFVSSFAGQTTIARFSEATDRLGLSADKISFHSSLLLQYIAVRSLMPNRMTYLLMHVHEELTDVVIVDRGACEFFGSYPTGTRTIARSIAHMAHVSNHAAQSLVEISSVGHAKGAALGSAAMRPDAVIKTADAWLQECRILCAEGQSNRPFPANAIISACAHEAFFIDTLSNAYPNMHIEAMSDDIFEPRVSFGIKADHARMPTLYAIAIHSIIEPSN